MVCRFFRTLPRSVVAARAASFCAVRLQDVCKGLRRRLEKRQLLHAIPSEEQSVRSVRMGIAFARRPESWADGAP